MFKFIFVLFLLLPLAELYLLIEVGSGIGGLSTIALCLLTAAIGGILVRIQGIQTLTQARDLMNRGQPPAGPMLHGLMIASSGILLFLPGFITDVVGFLLLMPPVRSLLSRWLTRNIQEKGDVIIDAEIIPPDKHHLP